MAMKRKFDNDDVTPTVRVFLLRRRSIYPYRIPEIKTDETSTVPEL